MDIRSPAVRLENAARQISAQGRSRGLFIGGPMATALVIDGAYFLRRFKHTFPHLKPNDPEAIALGVHWMSVWHLAYRRNPKLMAEAISNQGFLPIESADLYRIFFYDCPPLQKKMHWPVSKTAVDLSKTSTAIFRTAVHARLQTVRKVALRLGRLSDESSWRLKPEALQRLIKEKSMFVPSDDDFEPDVKQKGVDMRLGLDVAALAFKRQVDQIVMIAADGDFVPAAKIARREGIDVVLDPMWGIPAPDLVQHVDGIRQAKMDAPLGTV
ncbi:MAG TPA: NYN domain-containing protein [Allosphingosinicella sp.]